RISSLRLVIFSSCLFKHSPNGLNSRVRVGKSGVMDKFDPFGFDISVSAAKKKQTRGKRGMSEAFETSKRACEHPGCPECGQYRAPRSPDHLAEYLWFCKDHVREYNLKWNFFHGATEDEINEQADKDR